MTDGDEYERQRRGIVRSHRWLRRPWWVRGAIAGLAFGAAMFAFSWATDDDPDPAGQIVGAAVSAVLFAIAIGLVVRAQERRLLRADGRILTPEERITVMRSIQVGRWPDDARLHPAVSRLLDQRLRAGAPAFEIAVFVLMLAVAGLNVVLNGPWWWLAVVFWAVVGPLSMRSTRRRRAAAQALRDAAPTGRAL